MLSPTYLQKGDEIRLIAPSSPLGDEADNKISKTVAYFEKKGLKVSLGNNIKKASRFLAGSDEERAQDINDAFAVPSIKAIFCARGGYGSARVLPYIDYEIIKNNPKLLVCFSDSTALQFALYAKTGLCGITGFAPSYDINDDLSIDSMLETSFWGLAEGKSNEFKLGKCLNDGKTDGQIIGGCLTLIESIIGTEYMPDLKGKILYLEDVGEEPYKIDKMLNHLYQANVFKNINGLIWGNFHECVSSEKNKKDGTIDDIINEWNIKINKPAIKDFPYGHQKHRHALPFGALCELDANNCSIKLK